MIRNSLQLARIPLVYTALQIEIRVNILLSSSDSCLRHKIAKKMQQDKLQQNGFLTYTVIKRGRNLYATGQEIDIVLDTIQCLHNS